MSRLPRLPDALLAVLLGALAVMAAPGAAYAQTSGLSGAELDAATRAVASMLRCPVCQGESIQDSPADLAVEMRTVVREQLAAGRTPEQVTAYFVDRYGEWILLAPPARGFNLLLYVLPFVLLTGAGAGLVIAARRWQRRPAAAAAGSLVPADFEDEY